MDRSKTIELMPIMWRLGTGRTYSGYSKAEDLRRVRAMDAGIVPLLTEWTEHECCVIRTGAAVALRHIARDTAVSSVQAKLVTNAAGMKELNAYAHGGFEMLLEEIGGMDDKPQHLETFLPRYRQKLEKALQASAASAPAAS